MEAYIYKYTNKINGKTYIGSRSRYSGSCYDDFNVKYFSSSKDKEFKQAMSNNELEGEIILVIDRPDAKTKIVELEHHFISLYWKLYGKENSYNRYCNGKFSNSCRHHSDETKKKMSEAQKGRQFSEEHKQKISESKKGKLGTMFGKHHSSESRIKMSEAHKGKPNPMFGKHHSEETKMKMSESLKTKYKWLKPDGEIVYMDKSNAHRYHPDWIQIN